MTLGLLFGSFDPIHNGHINMVEQAFEKAGCDQVSLIVQPLNAYKESGSQTSVVDRLAMMQMALKDIAGVTVSPLAANIAAEHSIVASLRDFTSQNPSRELVLILGDDLAGTLPQWQDCEEIQKLCRVFVVSRAQADISSRRVRELAKQAQSISALVPPMVEQYITGRGLYS